jgi:hypothetical protein
MSVQKFDLSATTIRRSFRLLSVEYGGRKITATCRAGFRQVLWFLPISLRGSSCSCYARALILSIPSCAIARPAPLRTLAQLRKGEWQVMPSCARKRPTEFVLNSTPEDIRRARGRRLGNRSDYELCNELQDHDKE